MSERHLPELRVQLFGGPALFQGDEEIPLSPFQSYLLALVYAHGARGISRSKAAWLLWEMDDDRRTRHRLSQLAHKLKQKVGGRAVVRTSATQIKTTEHIATVDLDSFHLECSQSNISSLALRDPRQLLGRIDKPPSSSYDNWRMAFVTFELQRATNACAKCWDLSEAAEDWSAATLACATLRKLHPDDPSFAVELARLYLRAGEIHAAREEAIRAKSLNPGSITADPELRRLLDVSTPNPAPSTTSGTNTIPLIARDQEVARLFHRLRTHTHSPQPTIVAGESGIGKTRVCQEVLSRLGMLGSRVMTARCAEFESAIALNPILEAITSANCQHLVARLQDPWRSVLHRILPDVAQQAPPPPISEAEVPRRLFEAIRRFLAVVAEDRMTILFIDNFQWIDETSLAALQYFMRRWDALPLQILLAFRGSPLPPESTEPSRFVATCVRDGAILIHLEELGSVDALSLIRAATPDPPSTKRAQDLFRRAGGNPLFLIELCAHEANHEDGPVQAVPTSINNAIDERLAQSTSALKRVVQLLAVAGSTTLAALQKLSGLSSLQVAEALDEGMRLGLVRITDSGGYEPRHEVIGEVARAGLQPAAAAALHTAIGRHLESELGDAGAARIAIHYHRAGLPLDALAFALKAADRAEQNGAVPEAIRFLEIARGCSEAPEEEAQFLGRIAHLKFLQTQMAEAAPLLALAAAKQQEAGRHEASLLLSVQQFSALSEAGLLDHQQCIEELAEIEARASEAGFGSVVMSSLEAKIRILERLDRPDLVREVLSNVVQRIDALDVEAAAHAHMLLALEIFYGDPEIALASTSRAYVLAQSLDRPDLHLKAALRRFLVLIYQGSAGTDEGLALLGAVHDETRRSGHLRLKHTALVNEGVWHLEVRNLDRARELFREAESVIRGIRTPHDRINHLGNLGATYLEMGEPRRAEEYFGRAQALVDGGVRRIAVYFLNAGLGLSLVRQGRIREARKIAERMPSPEVWYFDPTYPVMLQVELLRAEQQIERAVGLLRHASAAIRHRMVPQWLTLQEHQVRLVHRFSPDEARCLAEDACQTCVDLGLTYRAAAFAGSG